MAKKNKDKFDLGMETDDLIDFLGEDTSFFGLDDDDDKKSEKKEEKKKLKKKLKKLGLDTSVLDEKKWKKKAKKMIKEAKEKKAEEKEKSKPIKLSKKDYKVSDVEESDKDAKMPPYYYDKDQDQWVINKAMKISDPEAVVAVKAFAKCRNMHDNALGKFQIGIPGSRKQLDAPKEKKGAKDKIDAAIEVIDEALDKIQSAKEEEPKSEALVGEVVGEPKPKKTSKKKQKVIDIEPVDETKAELMKATHQGKE